MTTETKRYTGIRYEIADDAADDLEGWTQRQWGDACHTLLEPLGVSVVELYKSDADDGIFDDRGLDDPDSHDFPTIVEEITNLLEALCVDGPKTT